MVNLSSLWPLKLLDCVKSWLHTIHKFIPKSFFKINLNLVGICTVKIFNPFLKWVHRIKYSLVCFALFCLVKRIIEYFAKKWSEQKVPITDVVGLYSTYQKYIIIGAPNSYQLQEKWTWVFYQKNLQKSKHFFYEK